MKTSKSIFVTAIAFAFLMASCRETPSKKEKLIEEHGHSHEGDEHGHEHEETINQEEFNVDRTATEMNIESDTHTHEDGGEHHNH